MTRLISLFAALVLVAGCAGMHGSADGSAGGGSMAVGAHGGEIVPGTPADFVASAQDRVFFAFDQSSLNREATATLKAQAAWLKTHQDKKVVVQGHCDERGTREYNIALGARRANAARDYLISLGVAPSRVSTISYGKDKPAVLGHNEAAWSQNRRAVTVVK